jgi:ComF family protein
VASLVPLGQRLLDLIFPPRCAGCGAAGTVLCPMCVAAIHPVTPPYCARCGTPLPASPAVAAGAHAYCVPCAAGRFPAALAGIRVAAHYEGPLRNAIRALKFGGQRRLAEPLGDLLAEALRRTEWPVDVLVPVPLHSARERERGYNQAALLARRCATRLGVPMRTDLLARVRATAAQTRLSAAERRENLAGAFTATTHGAAVAGRHIALVDDVTTTGSTLAAAAAALAPLRPAGVWGLAVARPDLHVDQAGESSRRR